TVQFYVTDAVRQFERQADVTVVNGVVTIPVDLDTYFTLTAITTPDTTPPTIAMSAPANGSTVLGNAVTVSASASDNVAIAGVQFKLDGANLGAEVMTSPYSIAWNTTATPLGSHTLAARARDASGKQTTSTAVTVTVAAPPPGVLAIDATASGTVGSPLSSITSSTFSTASANELLLAFIGADDASPGNTVTSINGAGLTWALVVRTNTQRGTAEVWRAFAPAPLTNVTATANLAQPAAGLIQIVTFTGVDTTGTNGSGAIGATKSSSAASGAPTGIITTTRANSWVWAA